MKATGIVRKVDELGRVVIPMELRRTMEINEGDGLEIFVDSDQIILKKYAPGCALCGSADQLIEKIYFGRHICRNCVKQISA